MNPVLRRRLMLFGGLLITLWVTWQVSQNAPEPNTVTARTPRRLANHPVVAVATPPLIWPTRSDAQAPIVDLFSLSPPMVPVKSAAPASVAIPAVPVFSFKFVGRLDGSDNSFIFLADAQDRVVSVKAGQPVDNDWQLSAVEAKQLVFRHIATGQQHILQIGALQ
jgi:hypothetical protein